MVSNTKPQRPIQCLPGRRREDRRDGWNVAEDFMERRLAAFQAENQALVRILVWSRRRERLYLVVLAGLALMLVMGAA